MNAPAFLIDTDWVIDHLNGIAAISHRLEELREQGFALNLSAVSVAELWEGVYFSRDPERSQSFLEDFLSGVTTLGIDDEICKRFARLRGYLRRQGKLIGDFDLLIAASALAHNMTLLTNNKRHVENVEGLRIESAPS
jgi:tRNA(fMet)-specific endonuclease VapC